jgi:hypothetical protein
LPDQGIGRVAAETKAALGKNVVFLELGLQCYRGQQGK